MQADGDGGLAAVRREKANSVHPLKKQAQVPPTHLVPPLTKEK